VKDGIYKYNKSKPLKNETINSMTEETKQLVEQFLTESEYYHQVANNHSEHVLNEVTYALQQANFDTNLLMSIFEDSQMWGHAMCLNDITISSRNESN